MDATYVRLLLLDERDRHEMVVTVNECIGVLDIYTMQICTRYYTVYLGT